MMRWAFFLAASFLFAQETNLPAPLEVPIEVNADLPVEASNFIQEESTELALSQQETPFSLPAPFLPAERPTKSPFIATSLASLFPGLGHFYLGETKTGAGLMGAGGVELGGIFVSARAGEKEITNLSILTFSNTLNYSVYAAYRDVRLYNRNAGYLYQMPNNSLSELTSAPFRWSILKKPTVWAGYLGALAVATSISHFGFPKKMKDSASEEKLSSWFPAVALPVGVGEEALFRGFLQPALSESLGPWGGIWASSILFGASHIPNAFALEPEDRWRYYSFSLPLITTMGVYLGWLAQKNHSLQESVALHTWYDFTLFSLAAAAQSAAIGAPPVISFSSSF